MPEGNGLLPATSMEDMAHISEEIQADLPGILAGWRESRGGETEEEAFSRLAEGIERVTLVFTEFLSSSETVDTFGRGGTTRALVVEIAGYQHELGRDAVGVIEDFAALRRNVWRSVERQVDLSALGGGQVAHFFIKLLEASDWVTEAGLAAYDIIVHEEMDEAVEEAAGTDLLTGLPDRDLFNRLLLPQAVEDHERFSLLVFDVARFSETATAGQLSRARETLQLLSDAVQEAVPEGGVCARFGDDEICALLPEESAEAAYRAAEDIILRLAQDPDALQVDAGIAEYPAHGHSAQALITETLRALKMAKRVGGGGIVAARRG